MATLAAELCWVLSRDRGRGSGAEAGSGVRREDRRRRGKKTGGGGGGGWEESFTSLEVQVLAKANAMEETDRSTETRMNELVAYVSRKPTTAMLSICVKNCGADSVSDSYIFMSLKPVDFLRR